MVSRGDSEKSDQRRRPNVLVYAVFLTVVFLLLGSVSLFISLILDGIYETSSSVNWLIYTLPLISSYLSITVMIVAHSYHGKPMFPFYMMAAITLGIVFYLFTASSIAAIPLALQIWGVLKGDGTVTFLSYMLPIAVFVPIIVGLVNSRFLRVRAKTFEVEGIPKAMRIFFFSDLHLGLLVGKKRLREVVSVCMESEPDIIIIGGDLMDAHPSFLKEMLPLLSRFKDIAPTYAVTGNHEYFNDVDACVRAMEDGGIEVLRNRCARDHGTGYHICGIDDPSGSVQFGEEEPDLERILKTGRGKILISHQPRNFKQAASLGVDLMLSGHTHGGQMEPFGITTRLTYRDGDRGTRKKGDSYLYVTTGAGTWGPPVRFLTSSEVAVIDMVPK